MKHKVLVIGASGMLGIEVVKELSKNKNVNLCATIRSNTDKSKIKKYLNNDISNIKFYKFNIDGNYKKKLKEIVSNKDYIINCVGVIKPYIDESDPESIKNALDVNSLFPHILNKSIKKKTKIFQIATDCVYNGEKGKYYEKDHHNATDIYGKSKSAGEVKSDNFFNIRCSIIGIEIKSFKSLLCWFLNQKINANIFGFKNHLWNGITTKHFGKIISVIITKKIQIPNMLHIVPGNIVNKYELLKLFQKKFKRNDLKITKVDAKLIVNRTLQSSYKKLNSKINRYLGYKKNPSIKQMIDEII